MSVTFLGCKKDQEDDYGSVRAKLNVADAEKNPLSKTRRIKIVADYNRCLADFYQGKGTAYQFEAPQGEAAVKEWTERLCAESDPQDQGSEGTSYFKCDPKKVTIKQDFSDDNRILQIEIEVTKAQAKKLLGTNVRIGPIPHKKLIDSDCEPKLLLKASSLAGLNAKGEPVWSIASYKGADSPSPTSTRAFEVMIEPDDS